MASERLRDAAPVARAPACSDGEPPLGRFTMPTCATPMVSQADFARPLGAELSQHWSKTNRDGELLCHRVLESAEVQSLRCTAAPSQSCCDLPRRFTLPISPQLGRGAPIWLLSALLVGLLLAPTRQALLVRLGPSRGSQVRVQQASANGTSAKPGLETSVRTFAAAGLGGGSEGGGVPAAGQSSQEGRASHWSLPNRPSLFSIIRFPNEECFDSSNQSGTCYTAFECKLLGGQPSSPCAAGFGSCCIVSRTCHVTTREKVVYFKNPSYPAADSDEKFCDLTVEMGEASVCQLRLDFLDFQLDPPTNGACKDDYMEISASGMPPQTVPRLCGLNRNQHLYINLPQDLTDRSASIVFYTDPVGDHRWQLKVTQIDCNSYRPLDWKRHYAKFASSPLWNAHPNALGAGAGKYSTTFASGFQTMSQTASALAYELLKPQFTPRAPAGCLQYFTQPSGIIESFNFGQYLNNMDYSICIQRQPDTCRVVFTSSDYDWSLNGVGVSGASSGVGDQDCARDYLLIPGASRTGDGFTYDRYCGGRLNYYRGQALSSPVVMKTSGPIVLRFHSDAHFEGVNNGGFRLQYDQSTQDCIYHTPEEAGSLSSQQLLAATLSDSRPLQLGGSVFGQDAPALYAAQQLGAGPVVQQVQHTDQSLASGEDASGQLSSSSSSPPKPMQPLQSGAGSSHATSEPAGNYNLAQQVSIAAGGNQIKRRQDSDDLFAGGGVEMAQLQQQLRLQRPLFGLAPGQTSRPLGGGDGGANLLGADLSKAFQLVTTAQLARSHT